MQTKPLTPDQGVEQGRPFSTSLGRVQSPPSVSALDVSFRCGPAALGASLAALLLVGACGGAPTCGEFTSGDGQRQTEIAKGLLEDRGATVDGFVGGAKVQATRAGIAAFCSGKPDDTPIQLSN